MRAPRYGSMVGLCDRQVICRVQVVREYKTVTKVRRWLGNGWSDVQDAHPDTVIYDGGRLAGWHFADHNQITS